MFDVRHLWMPWASACVCAVVMFSSAAEPSPAASTPSGDAAMAATAVVLTTDARGRIEVPRADDGLFYIDSSVNGHPIRFLIDTGSSDIVLTGSDARGAGLDSDQTATPIPVRTAGGIVRMTGVEMASLRIAGREIAGLNAVVAESASVSLLGQSALRQFGAITLTPDRIVIHP